MPLLFPDTQVATDALAGMFRDFVQELRMERKILEAPPGSVKEPLRLSLHLALLDNVLFGLEGLDPAALPREQLRQWVNIQYDVSQLAQEAVRSCLAPPEKPPVRGP